MSISLGFAFITLFVSALVTAPPVTAQSGVPLKERYMFQSEETTVDYYSERLEPYYYEVVGDLPELPDSTDVEEIVVTPEDAVSGGAASLPRVDRVGDRTGVFADWHDEVEWVEWRFDVAEEAVYEIDLEYYLKEGGTNTAIRQLKIDGAVPFIEAYRVAFYRYYRDIGEPQLNNIGDEVRPRQESIDVWRTETLRDSVGMQVHPFRFHLEPGEHTVRLTFVNEEMYFGDMTLRPALRTPTYAEVAAEYERRGYEESASENLKIQAEGAVVEKNDPTLRREYDGDPETEPVKIGYRRLNVMGGWRWRKGDQRITWSISVPEDGLYQLGMRVLKNWGDQLPAYRQIAIDGKVPFQEVLAYKFSFDRDWQVETISDKEGEPYLFYLTEGEHELTMTVKMGELNKLIYSISDNALLLSQVLREIVMITGNNPDPNYIYDLDEQIPDLLDNLSYLREEMEWKVELLTEVSVKRPAAANNFLTIISQLDKALKNPDRIHRQLKDLETGQESLGSWYLDIQLQPITIDYLLLGDPEVPFKRDKSNAFQRMAATVKNLYISFYKDYDSVGSVYEAEADEAGKESVLINVWMSRGAEWAEIVKEMADETFTPKTGIRVNMNIVPPSQLNAGAVNALLLAITSGRAPDVACGVASFSAVEFAIRGAVLDMTQFDDYEEVFERFLPGIVIPYKYRGGTYGAPETMNFRALFYRKDVVQDLGIQLPETWTDIYTRVLPVLYQNGMDFYYSIPSIVTGGGGGAATQASRQAEYNFAPFLFQRGGDFYTEDGSQSALDSPEAYQAFKEYCDLYTGYGLPVQANFYNRMRTGQIPMGVGQYGDYMRLSVAAPELAGRWGIYKYPGHLQEDGTIDRSVGGIALEGDVILSQTEYPEESWEFIKWWTSTEIQARFGRELEALIGPEARWNTANVEAFQQLPWKKEDLEVIKSTWQWARDMPIVLGGYFTGRHIVNAWTRVVMSSQTKVLSRSARDRVLVRDSIEEAVKDINRELRQKQEEYGVESSILSE